MDFGPNTQYLDTYLAASEEYTLAFANAVREAGGGDVIPALMPSHPNEADSCLIANALNFACEVRPISDYWLQRLDAWDNDAWGMHVDRGLAKRIGIALNLPYAEDCDAGVVALPRCISKVAAQFDVYGYLFPSDLRAAIERGDRDAWIIKYIEDLPFDADDVAGWGE